MLDTATAVYEAVEPLIIWKTLYTGLKAGPGDQGSQVSPYSTAPKGRTDCLAIRTFRLGAQLHPTTR